MRKEFKGFPQIFRFTFVQYIKTKGYKAITIVGLLLCFLLPAIIMPAVEWFGEEEYIAEGIKEVYYVDTTGQETDYSQLNLLKKENLSEVQYVSYSNLEQAAQEAKGKEGTLLLLMEEKEGSYQANVLLPEESNLQQKDAKYYKTFLEENFFTLLVQKSGLEEKQLAELMIPTVSEVVTAEGVEENSLETVRMLFGMIVPYMVVMVMYFAVLFYGQGVANSILMEKTSKLVDTFLIVVKPSSMMLGKVSAICLSGIIQIMIWIAALIGGFAVGTTLVRTINPETDMALVLFFDTFGEISGIFTISGIIMAILIIAAGMLLYCTLASIGGALAGKQEDLSSTNTLFVLVLIISFFITLMNGAISGEIPQGHWMLYIPFTAILSAPGQVLLGRMAIWQAGISLGIILLCTLFLVWIAGKIYSILILYKGNVPKPKELIQMLK